MADQRHIETLLTGADAFNAWRQAHPRVRPDLMGATLTGGDFRFADLSCANLRGSHFEEANLVGANFRGADATGANFKSAILRKADLSDAQFSKASLTGARLDGAKLTRLQAVGCQLRSANLRRTSCYAADFSHANLTDARIHECNLKDVNFEHATLTRASFVDVSLEGANLTGSYVHGVAVWSISTDEKTRMHDLIVSQMGDHIVTVDDLKVAQLVHLMLSSDTLRHVIDTMATKMVLVLGSFSTPRKAMLDAVREELRCRGYLPVIFDFPNVPTRTLTETVRCLAHLSRFIVADITGARCVPQELMAVVPHLPSVPVQPLLLAGEDEWGMFESFRPYSWVLPLHRYSDCNELIGKLHHYVIDGPERWLSGKIQ